MNPGHCRNGRHKGGDLKSPRPRNGPYIMSAEQPFTPDPFPTVVHQPPAGIPQQRPASEPPGWPYAPGYAQPPAPPVAPHQSANKGASIAGAAMSTGGGALVALGSFMPWATITAPFIGTISRGGMDGNADGHYTIWLGLIILGLGAARFGRDHLALRIPIIALALLAILIASIDLADVSEKLSGLSSNYGWVGVGPGLYVIFFGGILAIVGAFVRRGKAA